MNVRIRLAACGLRALLVLALLAACDTKAPVRQQGSGTAVDSAATGNQPSANRPEAEFPGRGELGLFDLRGPVEMCVWDMGGSRQTCTFNREGFWLTRDGQVPWEKYPMVERDEEGRITRFAYEGDQEAEEFEYNERGLMARHAVTNSEQTYEAVYAYDEQDNVVTITDADLDWTTGRTENPVVCTFTIDERDEHGNWTRRTGQSVSGTSVETRIITYFTE